MFFAYFFQTCKETQDIGALTKAADFVKAFVLGFQVEVSTSIIKLHPMFVSSCQIVSVNFVNYQTIFFQDALALMRLDELFLESFDITDGENIY